MIETIKEQKSFDGVTGFYRHRSEATGTEMRFSVYRPPQAGRERLPVLYYLSGLTCNEETFMMKAGAQRAAAKAGLLLVVPDTSPRGAGVAGEDDDWDFGTGAGFYVDATESPWADAYNMYSYVTDELPALVTGNFSADIERESIFGHSMGGHGALVCALRDPDRYRSVSAFAPVCAPSQCPWGEKAFSRYLGDDREAWAQYDAVELVKSRSNPIPILVDQGTEDEFLNEQLRPHLLEEACAASGTRLELRRQPGYDHSYYFIATFVAEHIDYHALALAA